MEFSISEFKAYKDIYIICKYFNLSVEMFQKNSDLLNVKSNTSSKINKRKTENLGNVEYEIPAAIEMRNYLNDREFPLDTVNLMIHELNHEEDIGKVKLHVGAYADEYARSVHAMAFTVGNEIFFRHGAYKPETEEGRTLLAHELKHVAQNKEYLLADNRSSQQLESEAEIEELKEIHNSDSFLTMKVDGQEIKLRKTQRKMIDARVKRAIEEWVENQEYTMSEEEYLKLLISYSDWLKRNP
ncbi:MAG: DUF4157 domain-containing protein [Spirochaetales bacterium]|nr:DUF4157 domain-containing protein [Spirochaetales bacterium]MDD7609508.1 DUF4157 domain-containing protein [Spirochaetales bacterium]MDY5913924.1 DUF4157 domain-containing protein [Treponema sp.]